MLYLGNIIGHATLMIEEIIFSVLMYVEKFDIVVCFVKAWFDNNLFTSSNWLTKPYPVRSSLLML